MIQFYPFSPNSLRCLRMQRNAWGGGRRWFPMGSDPKVFYSEAEAEVEIALLRLNYPFISECRVVTRKEKKKQKPHQ